MTYTLHTWHAVHGVEQLWQRGRKEEDHQGLLSHAPEQACSVGSLITGSCNRHASITRTIVAKPPSVKLNSTHRLQWGARGGSYAMLGG